MERRYCSQCGSPVDEQAQACGTCGAVLTSSFSLSSGQARPEGMSAEIEGSASGVPPMPAMPPLPVPTASDAGDASHDGHEPEVIPQVPPAAPLAPAAPAAPAQQAAASAYAYPYPYPYMYPYPYPYSSAPAYPSAYGSPAAPANAPSSSSGTTGANGASSSGGSQGAQPAPGYPAYPQGMPAAYAPYSPPGSSSYSSYGYPPYGYGAYGYPAYGYPAYGYSYPYAYQAYSYPMYWKPPRAPGETYALVVSWIVTVFGGLSIVCGLLVASLLALATTTPNDAGLAGLAVLVEAALGPIVAGGFAVYFGIRGILRKPSPRFSIPSPLFFLALTILVLGVGIVLWHAAPAPGSPALVLPLVFLAGILPAFAILAFTARRLGLPSTRRHVWMSLLYGLTLAPLLAIILELIATIIIAAVTGTGTSALGVTTSTPGNPLLILVLLLTVSLVAPIVEEGVKPLGAVLLMRRLRTPASAFLLGVAAGVGFDIFETIGYIGSGQADWVSIAIERIGAGLLHGVGAGMAALGWYYLINGRGVPYRWWRGIGGICYAVAQHAIFNGLFLVGYIRGVGPWLAQPWYIGRLPFQNEDFLYLVLYLAILGVLAYVTGRLARGARPLVTAMAPPMAGPPVEKKNEASAATVESGAR